MSNACLFSVITVCRNEADKIGATCDSIVSQSCRDFEWIVIDGGSTDGTLNVLEKYRNRIAVLVSEPDDGIYNAMNKGVSRATGQYVVFMNGGDCFSDSQVLETVSNAQQADIIYGDLLFDGSSASVKAYPDVLPTGYLLKNMLPHQASFIRRTMFEKYGLHDESYQIAGDYEMFARLLEKNRVSYCHVPKVLALFDDEGISKNPEQRMLRKLENHRVRKQYFPRYRFSLKGVKEEVRSRRKVR